MSRFYPVSLRADQLQSVVIGAGAVAVRKVRGLLSAGVHPRVIGPEVHSELLELSASGEITLERRSATTDDLSGTNLVFLTTPDSSLNSKLEELARSNGALVNRADDPDAGSFHVPAALQRGDVTIAVSTGGRSPAFAALLRDELAAILTDERLALLDVLAEARDVLKESGHTPPGQRWRDAIDARATELLQRGLRDDAVKHIVASLSDHIVPEGSAAS